LTESRDCYIWRKTLPSTIDSPIAPSVVVLPPVPVSETISLDGVAEVEVSTEFPCQSCAGNNVELEDMQWVCRDCGFAWDDVATGADSTPDIAGITEASKDWTDDEWSAWLQTHFADDEPWAMCNQCESTNVCQAVMSRLITCMNCFHTWEHPTDASSHAETETLLLPADKVGMGR